jgi:hypothetical protein
MSLPRLVPNSPDLARLVNEGYAVRIESGHLVVEDVPFVATGKQVRRGAMICPLDLIVDRTAKPANHVMWFAGGVPCDKHGAELNGMIHQRGHLNLAPGLAADCSFSMKPSPDGYANFYDKVVTYVNLVAGHAQAVEPEVTAMTFRPLAADDGDSVFRYLDTASSRAGITAHTEKLALPKVAIVGLGGTGGYLLDFLAKLPIGELHLYDGDVFATHNAFRAPGAASIDELREGLAKVDYYARRYDPMRRAIIPHPVYVTQDNVDELLAMDFVFLAMDSGEDKKVIADRLSASPVPFIDTGIGLLNGVDGLGGLVRVTTSLPGHRDHVVKGDLISYADGGGDEYESNIQVAELNATAAASAVIAFKKQYLFYRNEGRELHSLYSVAGNYIGNAYATDPDAAP